MRGTSNSNARGSSSDRRARRAYLLATYASDVPGFCRCYRCGVLLGVEAITIDRIVPGALGGRYVRENIRPACAFCNSATGAQASQAGRARARERKRAEEKIAHARVAECVPGMSTKVILCAQN